MRRWIETASVGIESMAVAIIAGSVTFGSLRFLLLLLKQKTDPFRTYKTLIGRSLLLALEFLVAEDVIRTVALELTPRNISMLGGPDPNILKLVHRDRDRGRLGHGDWERGAALCDAIAIDWKTSSHPKEARRAAL